MERSKKVIVTNLSALQGKHGVKGLQQIHRAVGRLIKADRKRGIDTQLIAIDRAADMEPFGGLVSNARDARQAKRVIDKIFGVLHTEYIMILGAPDVVPHVKLKNPMAASRDSERIIESDLPYACDAPYSTTIRNFLGPKRVIGRLPDVMGGGHTKHFIGILDTAIGWKSRPRTDFDEYFSLSVQGWRNSTSKTTRKLFGSRDGVRLSPSEGPYWTVGDLQGRVHLINCHGDTAVSEFYGESEVDPDDQPVSHLGQHLSQRVQPGTVVAAECCYGTELYEPADGDALGICQAYLEQGAWSFFGSTNSAYGPEDDNNFADLICGNFLKAVLDGASTGRAALLARQKYIRYGGYMEMVDLKTLAQFLLLGDPSVQPVKTPGIRAKSAKSAGAIQREVRKRRKRRKQLAQKGARLAVTTAFVAARPDAKPAKTMRSKLRNLARARGATPDKITSFRLHAPKKPVEAKLGRQLVARHTVFHFMFLKEKDTKKRRRILVVREVNGKVARVVEAVRH